MTRLGLRLVQEVYLNGPAYRGHDRKGTVGCRDRHVGVKRFEWSSSTLSYFGARGFEFKFHHSDQFKQRGGDVSPTLRSLVPRMRPFPKMTLVCRRCNWANKSEYGPDICTIRPYSAPKC